MVGDGLVVYFFKVEQRCGNMLAVAALIVGAVAGESRQFALGRNMHVDGIAAGTLNGEGVVAAIVVLGFFYPFFFKINLSTLESFAYEMSAKIYYIHEYTPVHYVHNYNSVWDFCQWGGEFYQLNTINESARNLQAVFKIVKMP